MICVLYACIASTQVKGEWTVRDARDRFTKGLHCQLELRPAECGPNALPALIRGLPETPLTLYIVVDSPLQT